MNTSDPKQQKQLLLLILLVVCLGGAIFYQSGVNKPALPPVVTKRDAKSAKTADIVDITAPFMRPTGAERDPFVTPSLFDELMDAPVANSKPEPGRPGKNAGLMPLPNLPTGGQPIKPAMDVQRPIIPTEIKTPPQFILVGTIVGNKQMAIIKGANGGDQVALGDQAADGSRLVSVSRESATFVKEGKSYMLTVGEN